MPQPAVAREDVGEGVAPTVAMAAPPPQARERYVTQRDLRNCGWTDGCPACIEHSLGAQAAVTAHKDECRGGTASEKARDQDLGQEIGLRRHRESAQGERFPHEARPGEDVDMEDAEVPPASTNGGFRDRRSARTNEKEKSHLQRR